MVRALQLKCDGRGSMSPQTRVDSLVPGVDNGGSARRRQSGHSRVGTADAEQATVMQQVGEAREPASCVASARDGNSEESVTQLNVVMDL